MPISLSSVAPLVVLVAACALGCSSDAPPDSPASQGPVFDCRFTFSGNTVDTGDRNQCAELNLTSAVDADGGMQAGTDSDAGDAAAANPDQFLSLNFDSATVLSFHAAMTLGPEPTAGSFSSETLTAWNITMKNAAGCDFSAGTEVVPTGSFTLDLSSLPTSDAGAPKGKLDATLYLHALSMMDCGPGDTEQISITF
jgi:hypothetical protein